MLNKITKSNNNVTSQVTLFLRHCCCIQFIRYSGTLAGNSLLLLTFVFPLGTFISCFSIYFFIFVICKKSLTTNKEDKWKVIRICLTKQGESTKILLMRCHVLHIVSVHLLSFYVNCIYSLHLPWCMHTHNLKSILWLNLFIAVQSAVDHCCKAAD